MQFVPTSVEGAFIVELQDHVDPRGHFARTFCEAEFQAAGIDMRVVQMNFSRNPAALTLRGIHYQAAPYGEPKIVQCVSGRIFDVAVDLRPSSPTFKRWAAVELHPAANRVFYIPDGCAHGFMTLEPESHIVYAMGAPFRAGSGQGVRWDDPAFQITWPAAPEHMSERDAAYPDFTLFEQADETTGDRA